MKEFFTDSFYNDILSANSKIDLIKTLNGLEVKLYFDSNLLEDYIPYSDFITESNSALIILDKMSYNIQDLPTKTLYSFEKYLNVMLDKYKPYFNDNISPDAVKHLLRILNDNHYEQIAASDESIYVLYNSQNPYEDYYLIYEFINSPIERLAYEECDNSFLAKATWKDYMNKYHLKLLNRQACNDYLTNAVSPKFSLLINS